MKRLQRSAILLSLVESLREQESWCGETNIQKAGFFLQEMTGVPLEFDFVLYKYGPYSFDLTDELTALRADSMLALEITDPKYGPRYLSGEMSGLILERFPKTVARYRNQVEFVAKSLGSKGVAQLERIATALYVKLKGKHELGVESAADKIVKLKPHIEQAEACRAVNEVNQMWKDAKRFRG